MFSGAGLGLRRDLASALLSSAAHQPAFVELAPENWAGIGGHWGKVLREIAESFVRRAEASGFKGIVITLDTLTLGWRPRDLSLASFPQLKGLCLANYFTTAYVALASKWLRGDRVVLAYNVRGYEPMSHGLLANASLPSRFVRAGLAWIATIPISRPIASAK